MSQIFAGPSLTMPSGEHFSFERSARGPEGVFRFTWTLAPGRTGPGEHLHPHEDETFSVVSGMLTLWIGGLERTLGAGDTVVVPRGAWHRFLNRGPDPVVVRVSLNGTRMEDHLVPIALHFAGCEKPTPAEVLRILVHVAAGVRSGAVFPRSGERWVLRVMGGLRRLGVRPFPVVEGWEARRVQEVGEPVA